MEVTQPSCLCFYDDDEIKKREKCQSRDEVHTVKKQRRQSITSKPRTNRRGLLYSRALDTHTHTHISAKRRRPLTMHTVYDDEPKMVGAGGKKNHRSVNRMQTHTRERYHSPFEDAS